VSSEWVTKHCYRSFGQCGQQDESDMRQRTSSSTRLADRRGRSTRCSECHEQARRTCPRGLLQPPKRHPVPSSNGRRRHWPVHSSIHSTTMDPSGLKITAADERTKKQTKSIHKKSTCTHLTFQLTLERRRQHGQEGSIHGNIRPQAIAPFGSLFRTF
jgi:hypothetical protein